MSLTSTTAIVCTVRWHGEHGAVVRLFTPSQGLQAGYVRGGRSTALRPVLMPSNLVTAQLRHRSPEQLASLTVELTASRAPYYTEPLAAAARGALPTKRVWVEAPLPRRSPVIPMTATRGPWAPRAHNPGPPNRR